MLLQYSYAPCALSSALQARAHWTVSNPRGLRIGQAVNGAGESRQGPTVENEVDANHDTNEKGASQRINGQNVHAETDGDESRKNRPPPPGELNNTRPGCPEQPSYDEEYSEHHGHSFCACVRVTNQEVSDPTPNERVQEV